MYCVFFFFFFFFQAEDGIRDATVTGVQTCALPICKSNLAGGFFQKEPREREKRVGDRARFDLRDDVFKSRNARQRSEERRVGKECRSRWSPDHEKKKRRSKGYREYTTKDGIAMRLC